jgi:hypothetical protein
VDRDTSGGTGKSQGIHMKTVDSSYLTLWSCISKNLRFCTGRFVHESLEKILIVTQEFGKFLGPGATIIVVYVDPDTFQTLVTSGSQFEYKLLVMILLSNLVAIYHGGCNTL